MPSIEISSMSSSASTSSGAAASPGAWSASAVVDATTLSVTVEVMAPPGFGGAPCSHSPAVVRGHYSAGWQDPGHDDGAAGGYSRGRGRRHRPGATRLHG